VIEPRQGGECGHWRQTAANIASPGQVVKARRPQAKAPRKLVDEQRVRVTAVAQQQRPNRVAGADNPMRCTRGQTRHQPRPPSPYHRLPVALSQFPPEQALPVSRRSDVTEVVEPGLLSEQSAGLGGAIQPRQVLLQPRLDLIAEVEP
jgi:hypothetical protein